MQKFIFSLLAIAIILQVGAQDSGVIQIPMEADSWTFQSKDVEFVTHKNIPAIKGLNGNAQFFLNEFIFTNGTIEFDVDLYQSGFIGISFRMGDNRLDAENFYIRAFWPVSPNTRTTLQYATVVDTMSLWDLTDEYQAPAKIHQGDWNHVKLVVSGAQMLVYVNDMDTPSMHVPRLEGRLRTGGISLSGTGIFANLEINSEDTEDLSPKPGFDPTAYDPRYLRNWQVTRPIDFDYGLDITQNDIPDSTTSWISIHAEHRALINLSSPFGRTFYKPSNGDRRLVWLKSELTSEITQDKELKLGFSDEVWVFINGQLLLVDKNHFGTPGMKEPLGRCTIDNTSINLPLQEGTNEILIAIANDFYGWGMIARLNDMDGIK